jgi:hypothetical protein
MRLLSAVLLIAFLNVNARAGEYTKEALEAKLHSFTKLRNAGFSMAAGGGALLILGIVLVSTAKFETKQDFNGNDQRITNDPQWPVGFLSIVASVPLAITGFVLGGVGNTKVQAYRARLGEVSLDLDLNPARKGMGLAYHF